MTVKHLLWIPAGGTVGFLASWIFADLLVLPIDLYYLIYFAIILSFFALYVRSTRLDLRAWASRRIVPGVILGLLVGAVMIRNVLSRPATEHLTGWMLWWAILWRGIVYGGVDGILLFAFPWIVTWRAFEAERKGLGGKVGVALVSWLMILFVTSAYHAGYRDFRSRKIVQPNIGSTIMSIPTLVTPNPVASPITHIILHVTAVVHSPYTELFLPPHREGPAREGN